MSGEAAEAVIAGAEIAGGHDGAAELVVRLRYPNGAESAVILDAEIGFGLMRNCGASEVSELTGHSWRKILEGL